jgi:hypothetical protein
MTELHHDRDDDRLKLAKKFLERLAKNDRTRWTVSDVSLSAAPLHSQSFS